MSRHAIPMLDLVAQHAGIEEELLQGFAEVLASGRFVLGEPVAAFETELAKACEVPHAIACNSGTDALWLALQALGIGPGDRVLCPAFSFVATATSVVRLGAEPVFADVDPATLNLDPADALERIAEVGGVSAILPVDLFGRIAELGPLETWAAEHGVPIVQDAAQSIRATDARGRSAGSSARAACFSFYPTKNLGALGDAGAVVTDDPELRDRIARLRVHGQGEPGVYEEIGLNSRMDALQAVALSIKLSHLERWTRARNERARHYDALFAEVGARPAGTGDGVADGAIPLETPAPLDAPARHTYHRYVVRVPADRRGELVRALAAEEVESEVYYSRGLHRQPALAAFAPARALPETDRAAAETLALPIYPELDRTDVERVVGIVTDALRR